MPGETRRYWVGIDVGTHSVGFAATEVDEDGAPVRALSYLVLIHDSGIDKDGAKYAQTRLAASGLARRTRRLLRRRRKRLIELDRRLTELGFPIDDSIDTFAAWIARATLTAAPVEDDTERHRLLSVAVRHMARHRGWRNPYVRVESLLTPGAPSEHFTAFRDRVEAKIGKTLPNNVAVGQIVAASAIDGTKLRGEGGLLGSKLMQSDNANELHRIAEVQGLSPELLRKLILLVFAQESPRGSALQRVGMDQLPGQGMHRRAAKATDTFQRFRITSVIANLRVKGSGGTRPLDVDERGTVLTYLLSVRRDFEPTWSDVADHLQISRDRLSGTAEPMDGGDRPTARPPVHVTDRVIGACKIKALKEWWAESDAASHDALIAEISDGIHDETTPSGVAAHEFLQSLGEDDMAALDSLHLPGGRAAYSASSLARLTERMLSTQDDLHDARKAEFGVDDGWVPPAEPIGAPVGNPAVDRVLKAVARWLMACESEWGSPEKVVIEHVRDAFASEAAARERDRELGKRYDQNRRQLDELAKAEGLSGIPRRSDLFRWQAITRQNGQCAYCGDPISFTTAEMDHVVPQAGIGSNNRRSNMLAVCSRCNSAKSNTPFGTWAATSGIPGVSLEAAIERTRHWCRGPGETARDHARFVGEVRERLRRTTEDPELDGRSMESVAWMARELRNRIAAHFTSTDAKNVFVYQGKITAEARRASGIEKRIDLIGWREQGGKSRLDRRHHAIDAAVVSLLDESIARTLAERVNLRDGQRYRSANETWKQHNGSTEAAIARFHNWIERMNQLTDVLNNQIADDRIVVMENLRLRLANGAAHADTITPFSKRKVGDAMPAEIIDRAATPALWTALTRHPDFDPRNGLPADVGRSIRVNGTTLGARDEVGFFAKEPASIAVRGGSAAIGSSIHHVRVYRIEDGKRPVFAMLRVFSVDLLPHRRSDLFSVPLPPRSISMRTATQKLRAALEADTATELGWLVVGDELLLDTASFTSGQISVLLARWPTTHRWRVEGFLSDSKLRLRPVVLAGEGLPPETSESIRKIVELPGWRPEINVVFRDGRPIVVRRDALGRPRLSSGAGLPVTWSVR